MGRRVAPWALAAWLAAPAYAAPLVVGSEPDPRVQALAGAPSVDAEAFVGRFRMVSVVDRAADNDCGGEVALERWQDDLEVGRRLMSTLKTAGALAVFSAAELEAACLDVPPSASDLVTLQLALADTHLQIAMAETDPDAQALHQRESDAALTRAAVFGIDLAAPPGFDDTLLMDFDARRGALAGAADDRPRLVIAGRSAGVRLNGRPAALQVPIDAVPGLNLVQAVDGGRVTAAALVTLEPGSRTLVWVEPGGAPRDAAAVRQAVAGLDPAGLVDVTAGDDALLSAAAMLVGTADTPVRYAAAAPTGAAVYGVQKGHLHALAVSTDRLRPQVTAWRVAVGTGPELRYTLGASPALAAGAGLQVSYAVHPKVVLGLAARPTATREPLPVAAGGGSLFRATVPLALEARYEKADAPWTPVLGLSGGAELGSGPVRPFGAATAGAAVGIGAAGGLRAEARIGGGAQGLSLGVTVQTELRR